MDDIKLLIDDRFPDYLSALAKLIQIESTQSEPERLAPFGKGPKEALDCALSIASEWGFETYSCDGAIGYAEWINDPDTKDYVGVLCHVDVVPAGSGWETDPYELVLKDGKMFGRGVLDNKGPGLSSLFALKLLKESGFKADKNVRVSFGTNEENGSKDIPFYLKNHRPPLYGFTPDSQFPAVYGEKGVVSLSFSKRLNDPPMIKAIQGDFEPSAVPDQATLFLKNGEKFASVGLRAPSNEPQLGKNALTALAAAAKDHVSLTQSERDFFKWIATVFHDKVFGEGLIDKSATAKWDIQITPYSLSVRENRLQFDLSLRYSVKKTEKEILELIDSVTPKGIDYVVTRSFPPKVFDKNHPMVHVMRDVYERVTGLDGEPIVTTGATYARFMPNIIAFGPSFPGQMGIAHNSNEWMGIEDIKKNTQIYYEVMKELISKKLSTSIEQSEQLNHK